MNHAGQESQSEPPFPVFVADRKQQGHDGHPRQPADVDIRKRTGESQAAAGGKTQTNTVGNNWKHGH